jgi:hypothetical protein
MKKARRPGRLPGWQEWSVYVGFGLLAATGIAWLLLDTFVRVAGEFGPEHHPAEQWTLIAHGVAAYAFLIVGGAMIPVHVTLGWNTRRNLKSGLTLAAVLLFLGATALGLYYLGDEIGRNLVSIVHWSVGLIAFPVLLIHALVGRRG